MKLSTQSPRITWRGWLRSLGAHGEFSAHVESSTAVDKGLGSVPCLLWSTLMAFRSIKKDMGAQSRSCTFSNFLPQRPGGYRATFLNRESVIFIYDTKMAKLLSWMSHLNFITLHCCVRVLVSWLWSISSLFSSCGIMPLVLISFKVSLRSVRQAHRAFAIVTTLMVTIHVVCWTQIKSTLSWSDESDMNTVVVGGYYIPYRSRNPWLC